MNVNESVNGCSLCDPGDVIFTLNHEAVADENSR